MSRRGTASAVLGAAAFLAVALFAHLGVVATARLAVCGGVLGAAAIVDLSERRIPNRLTIPMILMLLALWIVRGAATSQVAAGLVVALALLTVGLFAPRAIGMGDGKLALVIAFGLTGKALTALAVALLLAAGVAAARLLTGPSGQKEPLPLAPFFTAGALIALLV